jgi:cation:H+ antiporter
MVLVNLLMLAVSLYVLVKSSDYFIESASHIAKKLGVSDFLIGLTLVAFGTSIPELSSAIVAAINGYEDLVVGAVIGANITNIGFVVAICAIAIPIATGENILKRDGYILFFITLVFLFTISDGKIQIWDGIILLLLYLSYVLFLFKAKKDETSRFHFKAYFNYFFKFQYLVTIHDAAVRSFLNRKKKQKLSARKRKIFEQFREGLVGDFMMLCLTSALIVITARFFINSAVGIAQLLDISRNSIGLTLVAFGTTLPELSVSLTAAKKGLGNILIGNIIGSNIANITLVVGVSSLITTGRTNIANYLFIGIALIFMTLLLLMFIRNDWTIKRKEGIGAIILYVIYVIMSLTLK